ncbi:MAG: hypothetical protein I3270_01185 [Candidatus Moeniiplasma glomeromycotorum]|nr:hypothetical protein [Candidatus Moeniiplasma glomeromycotorum]MCE8162324.1 hypothetical protein [Candidatus Moeniiplasma glomeromycotorum]MCE8166248.1 hypothetical protein [Candidatus Moeniiplasma glomeromycotorum]MCE8166730.1 hypothetical protein [Candidatus Moeniiplasma glomeromycotorum]
MGIISGSFFTSEFTWCKNCGETLRIFQYLPNSGYSPESIKKVNGEEELRKRKFEEEHNENCGEKEESNLNELTSFLENRITEFRVKKIELESSFSKDYTTIKSIFCYSFFRQLFNSTYLYFRKLLGDEFFPYASSYIIFNGFENISSRGLNIPSIFRYKKKDSFIIQQTFRVSLSNKYEKELTELDSQVVGEYDFSRLVKTIAHELAHCLLGDFFRVCGYNGEYTHRLEHDKLILIVEKFLWSTREIQFLLPIQIEFIQEKISYFKDKLWHLQKEEAELSVEERSQMRKENQKKIKDMVNYLANLEINKEKMEEKILI